MVIWMGALSGLWSVGGDAGAIAWHGHEMLFGYASAALAGFVLTAIPNWTGRLPVSGWPFLVLWTFWFIGRAVTVAPRLLGAETSAVLDSLFLPGLAFVVCREVVAGQNWQNLRVAIVVSWLAALWRAEPHRLVRWPYYPQLMAVVEVKNCGGIPPCNEGRLPICREMNRRQIVGP